MNTLLKCQQIWNSKFLDVSRSFLLDICKELFDFSKPVIMDDASYFMIENKEGVGKRPSREVYSSILGVECEVVDFNPITNLVRFKLPSGEVGSNNIVCFKSNL